MLPDDTLQRRWRIIFSRLNQVEARAQVERPAPAGFVLDERRAGDAPRLLELPRDPGDRTSGGPCPGCGRVVTRAYPLVACSACLRVFHAACLPGACCEGEPRARSAR